jgi:hypothetical protein
MNRRDLLLDVAGPLNDERGAVYNAVGDFHDTCEAYGKAAREMFLKYDMHNRYNDAHNGAFLLNMLKQLRIQLGNYHEDNYRDGTNYLAQANDGQQRDKNGFLPVEKTPNLGQPPRQDIFYEQ